MPIRILEQSVLHAVHVVVQPKSLKITEENGSSSIKHTTSAFPNASNVNPAQTWWKLS